MFTPDDVAKLRALKMILKRGKYEFTGDAVVVAASLFKWLDELESKIKKCVVKNGNKSINK